jgi:hypothetical protein
MVILLVSNFGWRVEGATFAGNIPDVVLSREIDGQGVQKTVLLLEFVGTQITCAHARSCESEGEPSMFDKPALPKLSERVKPSHKSRRKLLPRIFSKKSLN